MCSEHKLSQAMQHCSTVKLQQAEASLSQKVADMRRLGKIQRQHIQLFPSNAKPEQKLGSIYRWKPSLESAAHILHSPALGSSALLAAMQLQLPISIMCILVHSGTGFSADSACTLNDCWGAQQLPLGVEVLFTYVWD